VERFARERAILATLELSATCPLIATGRRVGVRQQRLKARRERGVFGRQRRKPGTALR
jgi:hypothetical protein